MPWFENLFLKHLVLPQALLELASVLQAISVLLTFRMAFFNRKISHTSQLVETLLIQMRLYGHIKNGLENATKDLGIQCYYLFQKFKDAQQTIEIAACGKHWTYLVVNRANIPIPLANNKWDMTPLEALDIPVSKVLGQRGSDQRFEEMIEHIKRMPRFLLVFPI
jgi:hypothetical protein